jgi:integrase/recombinase XerC
MRLRGLSPDTIAQRTGVLMRLAAAHGGRPLLTLTEEELMAWADELAGRLAAATRAVYVSNVRSFYGWCHAEGRIPVNPAAALPVPRAPQRQPRPITEQQLAVAIENAAGRVRVWLILAAWCGLRAKEIAWLRAENIRLKDNPPYLLVADTKGRRERVVPMPPFVVAELTRYQLPQRGLCWHTLDGRPVSPNAVSWITNKYLHELNIDDTLHSLRHRFGTQVQRAVRDLRVTQELLGHTSPATTAGYAQVADADKYRAVTRLPLVAELAATGTDPANIPTIPMRSYQ